jgi:hypothetical protein
MGVLSFRTEGVFFGEITLRGGVSGVFEKVAYQGTYFKFRNDNQYLLPAAGVTLKSGYNFGSWIVFGGVGVDCRFGVEAQPLPKVKGFEIKSIKRNAFLPNCFAGVSYALNAKKRHCGDHVIRAALGYGFSNQGNLVTAEVFKFDRVSDHWGRNFGLELSETFGEVYTKSMGLLKLGYQYQLFGADTWLIPSGSFGIGIGEVETEFGFDMVGENYSEQWHQNTLKPGLAGQLELKLEANTLILGWSIWGKIQVAGVCPFPHKFEKCGENTYFHHYNEWNTAVVFGAAYRF